MPTAKKESNMKQPVLSSEQNCNNQREQSPDITNIALREELFGLINERFDRVMEYVDKNLHITSIFSDLYNAQLNKVYYPLDNKWGLCRLNTGQFFFVNTEDRNITPWIIMSGQWEPNVDRVLSSYAQPGMVVLDIGAHFGYYTVKLGSKIFPTGRILSFEPNPEVNAVCAENIKINNLASMATLYKHALGNTESIATLTRSNSNMTSANILGDQDADYSVQVQVRRLDDVVEPDFHADLIKLDAEGYEKHILDGAVGLLSRSPDCAIMIELGLERWERFASFSDLLPACGEGKELYAVHQDGTLEHFTVNRIRPFLLTCAYHECYFFIAPQNKVETMLPELLRSR